MNMKIHEFYVHVFMVSGSKQLPVCILNILSENSDFNVTYKISNILIYVYEIQVVLSQTAYCCKLYYSIILTKLWMQKTPGPT